MKRLIGVGTIVIFLVQLSPAWGQLEAPEWLKPTQGDGNGIWGLCSDSQGNTFVSGEFSGTVDFDLGPNSDIQSTSGSYAGYITKFDTAGNYQWTSIIDASDECSIGTIEMVGDTAIAFSGYYRGSNTALGLTTTSNWDAIVGLMDTAGVVQWIRRIRTSSPSVDFVNDLFVDNSGIIHAGVTASGTSILLDGVNITPGASFADNLGYVVFQFDGQAGTMITFRRTNFRPDKIVRFENDSIYIAGLTSSNTFRYGITSNLSIPTAESALLVVNPNGDFSSIYTYGGNSVDRAYGMAVNDERIFIAGKTDDVGAIATPSDGRYLLAFDRSTKSQDWVGYVNNLSSADLEEVFGLEADDSTVWMTGCFSGTTDFDNLAVASTGGRDIFISKWKATGGIDTVFVLGGSGTENKCYLAMADSALFVAGTAGSNVDFDFTSSTLNLPNQPMLNGFVARYATIEDTTSVPPVVVNLDLGPDTVLCPGTTNFIVSPYSTMQYTHLWSDGGTSNTLIPTVDGNYWLDLFDGAGNLVASDSIMITFEAINFSLGNDTTIYAPFWLVPNQSGNLFWSTGATTDSIYVDTTVSLTCSYVSALGCIYADDIQITYIDTTTNNSVNEHDLLHLEVFPNPSHFGITILANQQMSAVALIASDGRVVHKEAANSNKVFVERSQMITPGVYFLEVMLAGKLVRKRIIFH